MDFLASDDDLDTSQLSWSLTGDQARLRRQPAGARPARSARWSRGSSPSCPTGLEPDRPPARPAGDRRSADSRFEKAVALQQWFREDGGFEYYDRRRPGQRRRRPGRGSCPQDDGGRTGYCEQFAAAMAVMARDARHPGPRRGRLPRSPSRPATTPTSTAPTTCTPGPSCSSPAPAGCASSRRRPAGPPTSPTTPPQPISVTVDDDPPPTTNDGADADPRRRESDRAQPQAAPRGPGRTASRQRRRLPVAAAILGVLLVVLLVVVLALGPRDRAPAPPRPARPAGPEEAWDGAARHRARPPAALAAAPLTLADPRGPGPARSARRATSTPPSARAAAPTPTRTPSSPSTGSCTRSSGSATPAPTAPSPAPGAPRCRPASRRCTAARPKRARRAADWWPRSVFVRRPSVRRAMAEPPGEPAMAGRIVDHVG